LSNSFKIQPEHIETEAKIDTHLTWLILWTLLALHRHFDKKCLRKTILCSVYFDSSGIFDCHTALCDVITQIFSVYSVCNSHCVYQPKRIREVSQLNKLSVLQNGAILLYIFVFNIYSPFLQWTWAPVKTWKLLSEFNQYCSKNRL
jgi:hypothetical protein